VVGRKLLPDPPPPIHRRRPPRRKNHAPASARRSAPMRPPPARGTRAAGTAFRRPSGPARAALSAAAPARRAPRPPPCRSPPVFLPRARSGPGRLSCPAPGPVARGAPVSSSRPGRGGPGSLRCLSSGVQARPLPASPAVTFYSAAVRAATVRPQDASKIHRWRAARGQQRVRAPRPRSRRSAPEVHDPVGTLVPGLPGGAPRRFHVGLSWVTEPGRATTIGAGRRPRDPREGAAHQPFLARTAATPAELSVYGRGARRGGPVFRRPRGPRRSPPCS